MSNIGESLKLAWFRSNKILLAPFDLKKWFAFGLLAWLCGLATGKQPLQMWFRDWTLSGAISPSCGTFVAMAIVALLFSIIAFSVAVISHFLLIESSLRNKIEFSDAFANYGDKPWSFFCISFAIGIVCLAPIFLAVSIFTKMGPVGIIIILLVTILSSFALIFFSGVFRWIVIPSLFTAKMRGVSAWQAFSNIAPESLKFNNILFCVVIMVIEIILNGVAWGISYPIYGMLSAIGKSNFILGVILFGLITGGLISIAVPFFAVFIANFATAYTTKAFPDYTLLIPIYDGQGNMIDSRTIYELAEEEQSQQLERPALEPWQQLELEQQQANEAKFETPFDKPSPDRPDSRYNYFK